MDGISFRLWGNGEYVTLPQLIPANVDKVFTIGGEIELNTQFQDSTGAFIFENDVILCEYGKGTVFLENANGFSLDIDGEIVSFADLIYDPVNPSNKTISCTIVGNSHFLPDEEQEQYPIRTFGYMPYRRGDRMFIDCEGYEIDFTDLTDEQIESQINEILGIEEGD